MKLRVTAANPAGNVTLLVESPVPSAAYFSVANRLLAIPSLGGEQVGFLTEPKLGGAVRLEMMGGEFCGNAARCAGLYWAGAHGWTGGPVPVEISGCSHVLPVEVEDGGAWAEMPLPVAGETMELAGVSFASVRFEGIVHLIAQRPPLPAETVKGLLPAAAKRLGAPAVGMLFLSGGQMRPAVYVRDTDTLFWENSCASGSTAVACWSAAEKPDGVYRLTLRQPGGVIRTELVKAAGRIRRVRIGGPVTIGPSLDLTLSHID